MPSNLIEMTMQPTVSQGDGASTPASRFDSFLSGLQQLQPLGLLKKEYIDSLIKYPEYAKSLSIGYTVLHHAGLLEAQCDSLVLHPKYAQNLARGFSALNTEGLLARYREILIKHPQDAMSIADGLVDLSFEGLLETHGDIIITQPEYAMDLARGFCRLKEAQLLDQNTSDMLIQHPKYAATLATGFTLLNEATLLEKNTTTILLQYPEFAEELAWGFTALNRVGKLEQRCLDILISHPESAHIVAEGLVTLNEAGLLTEKTLDILSKQPEYTLNLAYGFMSLKRADLLKTHSDILLQHPEFAESLGSCFSSLNRIGLLETYRDSLIKNREFAGSLSTGLVILGDAGLLQENTVNVLINNPVYATELARGFHFLNGSGLLKSHMDMLIQHPEYAESLANSCISLKKVGLLTTHGDILTQHPEHALSLAYGLVSLKRARLLGDEYINILTERPEHANSLATGFYALQFQGLINTYRDTLIHNPEHAHSLASGLISLKKAGINNKYSEPLIRYPEHAMDLGECFTLLKSVVSLKKFSPLSIEHREHSHSLSLGFSQLKSEGLLNENYIDYLLQYPEHALRIVSAIVTLQKSQTPTGTLLEDYISDVLELLGPICESSLHFWRTDKFSALLEQLAPLDHLSLDRSIHEAFAEYVGLLMETSDDDSNLATKLLALHAFKVAGGRVSEDGKNLISRLIESLANPPNQPLVQLTSEAALQRDSGASFLLTYKDVYLFLHSGLLKEKDNWLQRFIEEPLYDDALIQTLLADDDYCAWFKQRLNVSDVKQVRFLEKVMLQLSANPGQRLQPIADTFIPMTESAYDEQYQAQPFYVDCLASIETWARALLLDEDLVQSAQSGDETAIMALVLHCDAQSTPLVANTLLHGLLRYACDVKNPFSTLSFCEVYNNEDPPKTVDTLTLLTHVMDALPADNVAQLVRTVMTDELVSTMNPATLGNLLVLTRHAKPLSAELPSHLAQHMFEQLATKIMGDPLSDVMTQIQKLSLNSPNKPPSELAPINETITGMLVNLYNWSDEELAKKISTVSYQCHDKVSHSETSLLTAALRSLINNKPSRDQLTQALLLHRQFATTENTFLSRVILDDVDSSVASHDKSAANLLLKS